MMKINLLSSVLLLAALGCTSQHNKIAESALTRGTQQEQTIINDLFNMTGQLIVDKYCAQARAAAADGDSEIAAAAVSDAITAFDKLTWLTREQQSHACELFRIAKRYVWSQRGLGNILANDWDEAQRRLEQNPE